MSERMNKINHMYSECCRFDDKSDEQQKLKLLEEIGEFAREALIYQCKHSGVKAMSHRETTLAKIYEEAIDVAIVANRCNGNSVLPMVNAVKIKELTEQEEVSNLVECVFADNVWEVLNAVHRAMGHVWYMETLERKVAKWHHCLRMNGCIGGESCAQ